MTRVFSGRQKFMTAQLVIHSLSSVTFVTNRTVAPRIVSFEQQTMQTQPANNALVRC